ncbi:hypothetical protein KR067_011982 [Drosophila pandora]|nr:hypothetical protein KR067_011982 [Drosophila pandora]
MSVILGLGQTLLPLTISQFSSRSSTKFAPFACLKAVQSSESEILEQEYRLDGSSEKLNLAQDIFRNELGRPHVFSTIRRAEIILCCDDSLSREPLPPLGNIEFLQASTEMVLGKSSPAEIQNRVIGIQTKSSHEALVLAAKFLRRKLNLEVCLLARPCNAEYWNIFRRAGFNCQSYQYYSDVKGQLNTYGLVADLMAAPEGAVVILDACAHNPTGTDPSVDEWQLIGHIVKCKKMLPVIHLESAGLASGDVNQDAWPVRYFAETGVDFLCAQSFDKNFGLYNDTIGQLMIVLANAEHYNKTKQNFEEIISEKNADSSAVSSSRIVAKVLNCREMRNNWSENLLEMHKRIQKIRLQLTDKLIELKSPGHWRNLKAQKGHYMYSGLSRSHIQELKRKHIYVPKSGRINLSTIEPNRVAYLAETINDVLQETRNQNSLDAFFSCDHIDAMYQYFQSV